MTREFCPVCDAPLNGLETCFRCDWNLEEDGIPPLPLYPSSPLGKPDEKRADAKEVGAFRLPGGDERPSLLSEANTIREPGKDTF